MRFVRSLISGVALCAVLVAGVSAAAAVTEQPPQAPGQEEFVPLSEIPPEEQIPAFTLVAIAYASVWLVLLAYVWSVSRRLQVVENELVSLTRKRS